MCSRMSVVPERLAVTVAEAAHMLGLSKAKLYPLITRGEILSFKIGRARRVPVWAIQSFMERQLQTS